MLGGQVLAELQYMNGGWVWWRGYVYAGGQLLAIQANVSVTWVHQDPVVKSQRLTNAAGTVTTGIEMDAWGGVEPIKSWNTAQQPRPYTTYERDGNGNDQAMLRNYHGGWQRFDQPDPYDGSANLADPQSFNRYSYVQNDPVNFVDPSGLNLEMGGGGWSCTVSWTAQRQPDGKIVNFQITSMHCLTSGGGAQHLSSKQQRKYDKARDKLVNNNLAAKLKAKCATLLALTGYSIGQIIGAVNAQQAYSGPDSTNISALNAGIVPPVDPNLSGQALSFAIRQAAGSVSEFFKNFRGIRAVTASFGTNPNDVYFANSGLRPTTILHESLHSLTGLNDIELARTLGLGNFSDFRVASAAISQALKSNGCT